MLTLFCAPITLSTTRYEKQLPPTYFLFIFTTRSIALDLPFYHPTIAFLEVIITSFLNQPPSGFLASVKYLLFERAETHITYHDEASLKIFFAWNAANQKRKKAESKKCLLVELVSNPLVYFEYKWPTPI